MEVELQHVEAKIARTYDPQERVHVGAVSVHQASATMNQFDHFQCIFLEEPERIRIGEHQTGHRFVTG